MPVLRVLAVAALTGCAACATTDPAVRETTGSTEPGAGEGSFDAVTAGITPLTVEQEREAAHQTKTRSAVVNPDAQIFGASSAGKVHVP